MTIIQYKQTEAFLRRTYDRDVISGDLRIGGMYKLVGTFGKSTLDCGSFIYRPENQFFRSWCNYYKRENNKNIMQWFSNIMASAMIVPDAAGHFHPRRFRSRLSDGNNFMLTGYGLRDGQSNDIRFLTGDGKDCFVSIEHMVDYGYSLKELT